jgi:hypothetical protein
MLVLTEGYETKETCDVYKSSFLLHALPSRTMLPREEGLLILYTYIRRKRQKKNHGS